MHGYGYPPQQPPTPRPSSGTLVAVRVILVVVTVLSCGLLGWAAMLRLAIVTRRPRDWVLLAVVVVLNAGLFAFIMATPDDPDEMTDAQALILFFWLVGVLAGVVAYYLYAEIRHYSTPQPYSGPVQPVQSVSPVHPVHPAYQQPNPYTVQAPPPAPAPRRLDQVRAELDELSDYLRKEGEGR
ncbi:hypothetical protein RI138_11850 [Streptomyces sp. C11-1]|uniref:Integral membrane protein n=1 Tax=Streptomyces durocortorensis TaxID=2811104 RepID=A0ABY9VV53_9ACTN|nr:hypothetical protein [Streptomyces durocortorensis]WNF27473.1 hypothetical protein RI138_11850 [Streptomyces durocortorensis]